LLSGADVTQAGTLSETEAAAAAEAAVGKYRPTPVRHAIDLFPVIRTHQLLVLFIIDILIVIGSVVCVGRGKYSASSNHNSPALLFIHWFTLITV